jgi:hypothetical protein
VASTDAEVVPAAAVAQGELAELVDDVVADAEVLGGLGWRGFGPGQVGRLWCGAGVMGAVGALGVVDDAEVVELGLCLGDG